MYRQTVGFERFISLLPSSSRAKPFRDSTICTALLCCTLIQRDSVSAKHEAVLLRWNWGVSPCLSGLSYVGCKLSLGLKFAESKDINNRNSQIINLLFLPIKVASSILYTVCKNINDPEVWRKGFPNMTAHSVLLVCVWGLLFQSIILFQPWGNVKQCIKMPEAQTEELFSVHEYAALQNKKSFHSSIRIALF